MEMNNHEIDHLVAEKVMGWEPYYDDGDLISFITDAGSLFSAPFPSAIVIFGNKAKVNTFLAI